MRWDVALDVFITRLGGVLFAPRLVCVVSRLVRKEVAQQSLGPTPTRQFVRACWLGLAHLTSVGG